MKWKARIASSVHCILLSAAVSIGSSVSAAEPIFHRIGGWPVDISADGSVLVKSESIYLPRYSYLIKAVGQSTEIDAFGGATVAVAISDDGTIISGHGSLREGQHYLAWIKKPGEGFRHLGTLGGDRSFVRAMSADGQTVVGITNDAQERFLGFRWTSETGMTAVDGLPNALESLAYGISADGRVILGGSTFICPNCDPGYIIYDCSGACPPPVAKYHETFLWTVETGALSIGRPIPPDTNPNEHGLLPLPQSVSAHGMSNDGTTIIGTMSSPNGSFVWRAATGFQPLPKLPGHFHDFYPLDVSANGNLVVGHVPGAGAVVWTPGRGTQLLETLLANEYGLADEMEAIFLEQATLVSGDGRTIAGHAGDDTWWILRLPHSITVPEPAAIQLLTALILVWALSARMNPSLAQPQGQ